MWLDGGVGMACGGLGLTQCLWNACASPVTTGPVMAEAMFQNREEVPVIPIYRYVYACACTHPMAAAPPAQLTGPLPACAVTQCTTLGCSRTTLLP